MPKIRATNKHEKYFASQEDATTTHLTSKVLENAAPSIEQNTLKMVLMKKIVIVHVRKL
jgi:hypothetical protein